MVIINGLYNIIRLLRASVVVDVRLGSPATERYPRCCRTAVEGRGVDRAETTVVPCRQDEGETPEEACCGTECRSRGLDSDANVIRASSGVGGGAARSGCRVSF